MTQTTAFCAHCGLRVAEPIAEHLEAIHGVCGRRYCEQTLTDGKCEKCDDGKTEV